MTRPEADFDGDSSPPYFISNRNMGSIKTGRKLLKTCDRGAF